MFLCLDCGRTFEEDKVATWKEVMGECWGAPCYEEGRGCPYCYGSYTETYRCAECNEWIEGQYIKLKNGDRICEECYTTYEIGEE